MGTLQRIASRVLTSEELMFKPREDTPFKEYAPIRWSREQIKRASGPLVYVFWGRLLQAGGRECLYIGMSTVGLCRPLSRQHHKSKIMKEVESMDFIPCQSTNDARLLETAMIHMNKPKYNYTNT